MVLLRRADAKTLVGMYASAAANHGRAIHKDHRLANRNARLIAKIYRELRRRGPEAQRELLTLSSHQDPNVRVWVGAHALEFAPAQGVDILEPISRMPGFEGANADQTLKEWHGGRLKFS